MVTLEITELGINKETGHLVINLRANIKSPVIAGI